MNKAASWAAIVAAAALFAGCDSVQDEREQACRDGESAYMVAQQLVVNRLVSPSTAQFPKIGEKDVHVEKPEGCRQLITSYVDSQNMFGGVVRSKFIAIMELSPDGEWTASGFNLSEFQGNGAVKRD